MKYSVRVFVFASAMNRFSSPSVSRGRVKNVFFFPVSFSLFRHIYIILQFPLCYRTFVTDSQKWPFLLCPYNSFYYFSCLSLICMKMRLMVCKFLFLFLFVVCLVKEGGWGETLSFCLTYILVLLSYFLIFSFFSLLFKFFWETYGMLIQKFLCFVVMILNWEHSTT